MNLQELLPAAENVVLARPLGGYDVPLRATVPSPRVMAASYGPAARDPREAPLTSEATVELLVRVKQGDDEALDRLLRRCIPPLQRWAHGRLPHSTRGVEDTADLVQDTAIAALKKLGAFDARHQGALQAYLRQALINRIRDIIRRQKRRPVQIELQENFAADDTSPLEKAIGSQNIERYEKALERLSPADREAIICRIECQYSYEELAIAIDKPNRDAARMAVTRAIKKLAGEMLRG